MNICIYLANTQSSAGTLFGATPSTPATGNLFGSSNSTNAAGTLFGSNASNPSAAGTLFGGSASTAPATSTTGNCIGNRHLHLLIESIGFGGGFGSTPATTSAFGVATTQPSIGGFGTPATSTAPTGGFGGFGATTSQPAASSAFGGFGATSSTSQPAIATGFGNLTSTPSTSTTGGFGGFGAAPATSTFGTATTATTGGFGGFGAAAAAKPSFGTLGSSANSSLFGAKPQQTGFGVQQLQQQQQLGAPQPVQEKVWQELALIRAHFDPSSPLCQFRVN
jgi:nuclear pore complex protein Nup54